MCPPPGPSPAANGWAAAHGGESRMGTPSGSWAVVACGGESAIPSEWGATGGGGGRGEGGAFDSPVSLLSQGIPGEGRRRWAAGAAAL